MLNKEVLIVKLHIWPKTDLGRISSLLGLVFVFLLLLKGAPLPDFFSGSLAIAASLIGMDAFIKRDTSILVLFSVLTGIYTIGFGISNFIF